MDIANNKHKQTDNDIGAEGAKTLSKALKTNTTLQALRLGCKQEVSGEDGLNAVTLPITSSNKQTTRLEQKEQEHWAMH